MIEVPVEDEVGDNHDSSNDVVSVILSSTSSSSRGGDRLPKNHQNGLSPRHLRLLQAERRRRAAVATAARIAAASSAGYSATDNYNSNFIAAISEQFSPTKSTNKCNSTEAHADANDALSPLSPPPQPLQTTATIRYSTPPKVNKMPFSASSSGKGVPNMQKKQHQQQQHIAELNDETIVTTTDAAAAFSESIEDNIAKKLRQLKKISPSNTTATTTNTLTSHLLSHDKKEHGTTITYSNEEEKEESTTARVKVSDRIRAFNHGSNNTTSTTTTTSTRGCGPTAGIAGGMIHRWNNNAATTTSGRNACTKTQEFATTLPREHTSSTDDNHSFTTTTSTTTMGEKSTQGENDTTTELRRPLHEQNNAMEDNEQKSNSQKANNEKGMNQGNVSSRKLNSALTHGMTEMQRQQSQQQHCAQQPPPMSKPQNQPALCPSDVRNVDPLKYYRIIFKGIVLILPQLDHVQRLGYQHQQEQEQQNRGMHTDDGCATDDKCDVSESYIGYGDIVGTSSPEIIISLNYDEPTNILGADVHSIADHGKREICVRAIRVDTILTKAYSDIDDGATFPHPDLAQKHQHQRELGIGSTAKRSDFNENMESTATIASHHHHHQQQQQHPPPPKQHKRGGPHGYILLSDVNNQSIAEPLATSTANAICSSRKHGPFMYRVNANSPVPVLSGPSTDATGLGMGLLPGTIHEISLRISVPLSPVNDASVDVKDTLVDDADASEIQFLRLAQRRGWVADRTVNAIDQKLRVLYLMRDVTNDVGFRERFNQTLTSQSDCSHRGVDRSNGLFVSSSSNNVEDNASFSSSASVANSFYSSIVASSVTTPASIKSRRRHNRRRPRADGIERTQAMSISSVVQNTHRIGESFEEAGSSVTGDGSSDVSCVGGTSMFGDGNILSAKRRYLIRVIAPLGLKILDNTDFQVSSLIHSPSVNTVNAWGSSISPFSRTNAMINSSSSANNSPTTATVRKGNTTRVRIFARGQIFEACQRMEVSSESTLYTNGHGLIKLADGSGWAIVPYQNDLMAQFKSERYGVNAIEFADNASKIAAYEEIGNAFLPAVQSSQRTQPNVEDIASDRLLKDIVWLRVVAPPSGTRVLLPPTRNQSSSGDGQVKKKESNATPPKEGGHNKMKPSSSYDSETASSVVSTTSFLDSVWNKITPLKENDKDHVSCHQTPVIPLIPCGMVVPVEPWDRSANPINFCRLFNGQGWIPRQLGEEIFACEVNAPDIRVGSFWFRVSSRSGVDVRHGPSLSAPLIKSESGAKFRFECGEFLRASDVITVFEKSNPNVECYAKLFRRNNYDKSNGNSRSLLSRFSSLDSFATCGEWVQVHGRGELLLEECAAAPTIARSRDGFPYTTACDGDNARINVFSGPSLQATIVRELNCEGKIFLVTEKVTSNSEEASWLRLKSGGWIRSIGRNGKSVVRALHDRQDLNNGSSNTV